MRKNQVYSTATTTVETVDSTTTNECRGWCSERGECSDCIVAVAEAVAVAEVEAEAEAVAEAVDRTVARGGVSIAPVRSRLRR